MVLVQGNVANSNPIGSGPICQNRRFDRDKIYRTYSFNVVFEKFFWKTCYFIQCCVLYMQFIDRGYENVPKICQHICVTYCINLVYFNGQIRIGSNMDRIRVAGIKATFLPLLALKELYVLPGWCCFYVLSSLWVMYWRIFCEITYLCAQIYK